MRQGFFNLIFPPLCYGCNEILMHREIYICTYCQHHLERVPISENDFPELLRRFYGKLQIKNASALLFYEDGSIAKQLIHHLKYKNQQEIGIFLAEMVYERSTNHRLFNTVDEIVSIPLHPKKQKERGYNQLDFFCQKLSELFNIPYNGERLKKNFYSKSQTKKSLFSRSEIHQDMFTANFDNTDSGKHFLLIDDVVTTGSTIEKAGNELLKIENVQLSIFTIACAR
ncbi:ComF family protein [Paenimyroides ceti]